MIPPRLRETERGLRMAIARHQYADLARILEELRRTSRDYLKELPVNEPIRLEIAEWGPLPD